MEILEERAGIEQEALYQSSIIPVTFAGRPPHWPRDIVQAHSDARNGGKLLPSLFSTAKPMTTN